MMLKAQLLVFAVALANAVGEPASGGADNDGPYGAGRHEGMKSNANATAAEKTKALASFLVSMEGMGCAIHVSPSCGDKKGRGRGDKEDYGAKRHRRSVDASGYDVPQVYAPPAPVYQAAYSAPPSPVYAPAPTYQPAYAPAPTYQTSYAPAPTYQTSYAPAPTYQATYAPAPTYQPVYAAPPPPLYGAGYSSFIPAGPAGLQINPFFAYSLLANAEYNRKKHDFHEFSGHSEHEGGGRNPTVSLVPDFN